MLCYWVISWFSFSCGQDCVCNIFVSLRTEACTITAFTGPYHGLHLPVPADRSQDSGLCNFNFVLNGIITLNVLNKTTSTGSTHDIGNQISLFINKIAVPCKYEAR